MAGERWKPQLGHCKVIRKTHEATCMVGIAVGDDDQVETGNSAIVEQASQAIRIAAAVDQHGEAICVA